MPSLLDAHALRQRGLRLQSLDAYRAVAQSEANPHDRGGAMLWVAHLVRETGGREEALQAYRDAAAFEGAHPHDRGGARMWTGHLHREAGRLAEAREAYAEVLSQAEAHPHDRGGSLVWLGELMRQQGDAALSRDVLESLRLVPGSAEPDFARAAEILRTINGLPNPDSAAWEPAQTAGYHALDRGDRESARVAFEKALSLAGTSSQRARSRNQLAMLLQDSKRFQECRALLSLSLADSDAQADARADAQYILAHSFINEGDWAEARKAWSIVLDMEGSWPAARSEAALIVGQGLVEERQLASGREVLQRCVDNPQGERWHKWESLASIASSWIAEGNRREAARVWERLLTEHGLDDDRRRRAMEALDSLR